MSDHQSSSDSVPNVKIIDGKECHHYYSIVVDPKQTQIRIDKYLIEKLEKVSRTRIQKALKLGAITINENIENPNYKVRPNDLIDVWLPKQPKTGQGVEPQAIPLDIRYEDDHIMVVHKPAGLVVHPGVGNWDGTLVNALAYHLKNQDLPLMEGNAPDRACIVHRIDKNTTGLMVVGKTDEALSHLGKQFRKHSIDRTYQAIVWGCPDPEKGTITGNLGRDPNNRLRYKVFDEDTPGTKHAITHYEVLEDYFYVSLIKCKLETGRTHQIRVHLKHLGHTLFGDERYGGNTILKGTIYSKYKQFFKNCMEICPRQALHASSLGFIHPITEKEMFFEAPLPTDMLDVLDKWRRYVETKLENKHS